MNLIRAGKFGLYLLNLGLAGVIACYAYNARSIEPAHDRPTTPYHQTYRPTPATPQTPPPATTAPQAHSQSQIPVDPRIQALTLEGMTEYNGWLPTIIKESERTGVPARTIALCALVETDGHARSRYRSQEERFKKNYVDPIMDGVQKSELKGTLDVMLAEQLTTGAIVSEKQFRENLATSYGPMQIIYINAVRQGYRGAGAELGTTRNSVHYGALQIKARANQHNYDDEKMAHAYNCGSLWKWVTQKDGTRVKVPTKPSPNHLAHTRSWAAKLRR